uniref:uncharacterized protein LOC131107420 n=1 Tax=Doryrhamphus excisus TaxID=161450 RepID=UPI0025AEB8A0|nr:uncharacterized protein LOC131107420 [Doryrhamphus excisus]XP_057913416.1 uncharacterized protein LOC131107420 [Doryrhamphus excisus]XP_057913417.1 uncharacterized protein LOC131107420 [Doryrhamphus excisus]
MTIATNSTTELQIPISSLKGFTNRHQVSGETYAGYWWYVTGHVLDLSWDTLITTQEGDYWAPGTTLEAKYFHNKIMIKKHGAMLSMTFAFSSAKLNPYDRPLGTILNTSCWGFLLWAYSSGADPYFPIIICENQTMTPAEMPITNNYTRHAGVKIAVIRNADDWFQVITGISQQSNNWLLLVEQAANMSNQGDCVVCMEARPLLQVVPSALSKQCLLDVMNNTLPSVNCLSWDKIYPLTSAEKRKPIFSNKVAAGNFSCVKRIGKGRRLGKLKRTQCHQVQTVDKTFRPKSRSDIWWWCGDDKLYDRLPYDTTGLCASVSLILPVSVIQTSIANLLTTVNSVLPHSWKTKTKRSTTGWSAKDPTYIDSIGVPRGVPDEYKLVNQIAAGFESSICWWCTINKNVDRINYIHYNVQKLGNNTERGFSAIHEQLSATSLMAFQNRIAVDMLLAEKGGVCAIFGDQCCTFIPNNTAADGSLTKALEGLRSLNSKMKDHSGVDTSMWGGFGDVFGKYKQLIMSVLMLVAVFAAILTLCGCCCIPCIRVLCTRLITTAIQPIKQEVSKMYALLTPKGEPQEDSYDEDTETEEIHDKTSWHFQDLFSDPGDYAADL